VTVRQISKINVRARIETILHIVLKLQIDRACFHRGDPSANIGGKVEQRERNKDADTSKFEARFSSLETSAIEL